MNKKLRINSVNRFLQLISWDINLAKFLEPNDEDIFEVLTCDPEYIKYIENPKNEYLEFVAKDHPELILELPYDCEIKQKLMDAKKINDRDKYDYDEVKRIWDLIEEDPISVLEKFSNKASSEQLLIALKRAIEIYSSETIVAKSIFLNIGDIPFSEIEALCDRDIELLSVIRNISKENQFLIYEKYGLESVYYFKACCEILIDVINNGFNKFDLLPLFSSSEILVENLDKLTDKAIETMISDEFLSIDDELLELINHHKIVKKEIMKRKLKNR